ncbi:hypothetical protein F5Y03DRAFT_395848 [Xylaria venustula]|nr:hypothetical protein F5Y03DRAFT_395848 [Xylaria venustula]
MSKKVLPSIEETLEERHESLFPFMKNRYYDNGGRLWTKEILEDLQKQLKENPEMFTIPKLDGTVIKFKNYSFGEDPSHWRISVIFLGWRHLLYPMTHKTINLELCPFLIQQRDVRRQKHHKLRLTYNNEARIFKYFDFFEDIWAESPTRRYIEQVLSGYELPPTLNKIVCFGLRNDLIDIEEPWLQWEHMSQYLAILSLQDFLEKKLGHQFRLLTQDPDYSPATVDILKRMGFEVVGLNGLDGFLEVDENSLVFSVYVSTRAKEILAELTRPARTRSSSAEEESESSNEEEKTKSLSTEEKPLSSSEQQKPESSSKEEEPLSNTESSESGDWPHFEKIIEDPDNPDTPRTLEMFSEYYDAGLWAKRRRSITPTWAKDLQVWVRKNGSKVLEAESLPETENEGDRKHSDESPRGRKRERSDERKGPEEKKQKSEEVIR